MPNLHSDDARWLAAAAALAERACPSAYPNPGVAALIVREGRVIARGWTQPGGRPHAEAVALEAAGDDARGATLYVTLEPCAHSSARGPACADLVIASGLARVVVGATDPDPRTAGAGAARIGAAGISVTLTESAASTASRAGYLTRAALGRPHITLKLALSLDGAIALASGESQWITGPQARAHGHVERSRADALLVGGGTLRADAPRLGVRLPGYDGADPARWVLTRGAAPAGWRAIAAPADVAQIPAHNLLVEGGAGAAAAFLAADLIDRLLIYRAPIIVGGGLAGIGNIGLTALGDAHGRWRLTERRTLGSDTLEVYARTR